MKLPYRGASLKAVGCEAGQTPQQKDHSKAGAPEDGGISFGRARHGLWHAKKMGGREADKKGEQ